MTRVKIKKLEKLLAVARKDDLWREVALRSQKEYMKAMKEKNALGRVVAAFSEAWTILNPDQDLPF